MVDSDSKIRLLMVDDDALMTELFRRKFSHDAHSIEFSSVCTGQDCVDAVLAGGVDCVLCDLSMPGMDGLDILEALKECASDTPVIILTGRGNETFAREAFKRGAFDYFTKDAGFDHFPRIVHSVEQAVNLSRTQAARERVERYLSDEKSKFYSVIEGMTDGVCLLDREYRVLYMNDAYKKNKITEIGDLCYEKVKGFDRICEGCPVEMMYEDGNVHSYEHTAVVNGQERHFDVIASPLKDSSGKVTAAIKVVRDVTERVIADRQKADLYAMIRHDIKTPIALISGSAESLILDNTGEMDDDSLGMLEVIRKNALRLSAMIEDLVAVATLEKPGFSLRYDDVSVYDLMLEVKANNIDVASKKGLELVMDIKDEGLFFQGEFNYLLRALMNLVSNALAYTPEGGRVTLSASHDKDYVRLSVSDNGPGIPPGDRDKVFLKYFRSDKGKDKPGSGLGLAIVKSVAEAHKGRVSLECSDEGGCAFTMHIPVT